MFMVRPEHTQVKCLVVTPLLFKLLAPLTNIRLSWKSLPGKNT
jgi:hypothetical protein